MKRIPLRDRGGSITKWALVDDRDYRFLIGWKWYSYQNKGNFYAARQVNGRMVLMHRVIMKTPWNLVVNHLDGNGLHNYRKNLESVTQRINAQKRTRRNRNNTSGTSGVYWRKSMQKWGAFKNQDGVREHLGFFRRKIDAIKATKL